MEKDKEEMKDKRIIAIQKEVDKFIIKRLESLKDKVEQLSAYIYYIVFHKYFKEILICYYLQDRNYPNDFKKEKLIEIAERNTKQDFDITEQQVQEVREGLWKEILEAANGDEKKALSLYCSDKFKPTYKYVK